MHTKIVFVPGDVWQTSQIYFWNPWTILNKISIGVFLIFFENFLGWALIWFVIFKIFWRNVFTNNTFFNWRKICLILKKFFFLKPSKRNHVRNSWRPWEAIYRDAVQNRSRPNPRYKWIKRMVHRQVQFFVGRSMGNPKLILFTLFQLKFIFKFELQLK